jgi:citrate lyase subunit beta/citryl-CoA lyase
MLYIPGNNPGMIQHAPVFGADSVLLDLEDAVALSEKDAARRLTARLMEVLDFGEVIVTVRVNGADTPFFERDLEEIVPRRPAAIRLPKCSSPEDLTRADELMARIEERAGLLPGTVKIHAMLETARGVARAGEIAAASPRVTALTLGGQDLTADLGVAKTREGWELFVARSQVALAAHSAGLEVFDTVWADVNDNEGLLEETKKVIGLGFTGKAAIHPGQIPWIHRAFVPEDWEIAKAVRIVAAAEAAEAEGRGVVAVDGKMVDAPVVTRARHLVELARRAGKEVR